MTHAWNKAAAIRKSQIENGCDITFCDIFLPYYENLTERLSPVSLLEIGCGTGHLLKRIAHHADHAFGIEPSQGMFEVAKATLEEINIDLVNCTIENYNYPRKFDLIISHLCAQCVGNIKHWFDSIRKTINKSGLFVFSIPHPCFYNEYKSIFMPQEYEYAKELDTVFDLTISLDNLNVIKNIPYFHRPISTYINQLTLSGFSVKHIDEVIPNNSVQKKYGVPWKTPRYMAIHATTGEIFNGS
ncbi:class I SAM-dependent methyltransferase [Solidesulfovibrio carbinolicus]|uniref:Methyltransferase type 11 n=1 Tax=Solidesulfovibrio carbinolicus TaxID=296842 RepID=A0A4P6HH20_9BACT|nr:class I SAM-dependent methyltransferase [Solidesulfovibrio carbinolicus]QAZ66045.1 methyltransferase type 11 [Solidesulfovibrio carbinolicus]